MSLCNLSCIFVGICSIGDAARSTKTGPFLAELTEPDDGENEKLDSCVTGLDELDSNDSWRRLSE